MNPLSDKVKYFSDSIDKKAEELELTHGEMVSIGGQIIVCASLTNGFSMEEFSRMVDGFKPIYQRALDRLESTKEPT